MLTKGAIEWMTIIFHFVIIFSNAYIFFSARRIYILSNYKGVKYFSWAWLYFGIAFSVNLALVLLESWLGLGLYYAYAYLIGGLVFQITLIMGALMVAYSSVHRHIEEFTENMTLGIDRVAALHVLGVLVALLSAYFWQYTLWIVVFVSLTYAIINQYGVYARSRVGKGSRLSQLYFISLVFVLVGFILNFVNVVFKYRFEHFSIYVLAVTGFIFVFIAGSVFRVTSKKWLRKGSD